MTRKKTSEKAVSLTTVNKVLNIFCQVERLAEYEPQWAHFSVNLSAALSGRAADITEPDLSGNLQLWNWDWTNFKIRGIRRGTTQSEEIPAEKIENIRDGIGVPNEALKDALEAEFDETFSGFGVAPFLWSKSGDGLDEKEISAGQRDWKSFLAHVSTFPAPLPHGIKLTTIFRIRKTDLDAFDEIVAAPIFTGEPLPGRAPETPPASDDVANPMNPLRRVDLGLAPPPSGRAPFFYEWNYAGAGLQAFAYQKECRTEEPLEAGEFLNLKTLWLRKPASDSGFRHDWTLSFETKIAEAFDMSARLLDGLRSSVEKMRQMMSASPAPAPSEIEKLKIPAQFHNAFIASLRDVANYGLSIPPDGNNFPQSPDQVLKFKDSLAQFVLAHERLALTPPRQRMLLERLSEEDMGITIDDWKSVISEIIGRVENSRDESPVFLEPPPQDAVNYLEKATDYLSALERVYAALADERVLLEVLLENWKTVFESFALGAEVWTAKSSDIRIILSNLQLRKRLLLGNAGIGWRSLSGRLDNPTELKRLLKNALLNYYENRFEPATTVDSPYRNYFPRAAKIPDATPDLAFGSESDSFEDQITIGLSGFAERIVTENILPQANAADDAGGAVVETLTLQVDKMERDGAGKDVEDQNDLVRRLAGIGVLLRRDEGAASLRDWSCLNLAQLKVKNTVVAEPAAVPIPVKLQYRNGVRQVFVSYDNQPLAAQSPAADLSKAREMRPSDDFLQDADNGEAREEIETSQLLSFLNPYGLNAAAPKLEGLIYGKDYDATVFLIGSAGNLPKELAQTVDAGSANERKIPYLFARPAKDATFNGATIYPLEFRRQVKVGSIRFGKESEATTAGAVAQETQELNLPPIPAGVYPLTRSKFSADNKPLVLLVPPNRSLWNDSGRRDFKFSVRPPSIDLKVWDRWIADGSITQMMRERETIWAEYHERNDTGETDDKKLKGDATIDDPSVVGFTFSLELKNSSTSTTTPNSIEVEVQRNLSAQGLKLMQSDAIEVEIESKETGQATLIKDGAKTVKIAIPAGEIWQLKIEPKFSAVAERKFNPSIWQKVNLPEVKNTVLYIEVAKAFFDEATVKTYSQNLHNAVQLRHETLGDRIQINLAPVAAVKDLIYGVDLLMQRWRWDGRPLCYFDKPAAVTVGESTQTIYGFPFAKVNEDGSVPDDFAEYDGIFFGSRESSDHKSVPKQKDFASVNVGLPAPFSPPLYDEELTGSAGALYFRVAARVTSRYAGLMRRDTTLDSRLPAENGQPENWKRLVIRARYNKTVPRPAIKMIVPLSQTLAEKETPGLLVILDEAAYGDSIGGLAESFRCDVVRVARPDFPNETRAEFASDPILDMSEDAFRESRIEMPPVVGAIGYTFDTDTLAPLFHKASFIQPPPAVKVSSDDEGTMREVKNLWWHFIKLRFRRELVADGIFKTNGRPVSASPLSEWTEPVWVQLLPAANRFRLQEQNTVETTDVDGLRFNVDGKTLERKSGGSVTPLPTQTQTGSKCKFVLFALITTFVTDAFGRQRQETFVDFKSFAKLGEIQLKKGSRARIRLVEIQYRDGADISDAKIYEKLFPKLQSASQQAIDAEARIVRVSPPIDE